MVWTYLWTVILVLVLSSAGYSKEETFHVTTSHSIPDDGKLIIPIGEFSFSKIKNLQLEINIKHTYMNDLVVVLVAPNGRTITLLNRTEDRASSISLYVTSLDALSELLDVETVGQWEIVVFDKAQWDVGVVTEVYFVVEGEEELGLPAVPSSPVSSTISSRCLKQWEQIKNEKEISIELMPLVNLCGKDFRDKLREIISTNIDLGYKGARKAFFEDIDNFEGVVCSVYTSDCLETLKIPNSNVMNCEHTWPQSRGATGIAKSDLHHLYPTESKSNSLRSNWPFCKVDKVYKQIEESKLGYSLNGNKCFEPPLKHKGNVARSMVYFAVRYGKSIDFEQEEYFRKWNDIDPVDAHEKMRNNAIERHQGNRNPFVDYPQFIQLIADF